jgi:hypothetical protein
LDLWYLGFEPLFLFYFFDRSQENAVDRQEKYYGFSRNRNDLFAPVREFLSVKIQFLIIADEAKTGERGSSPNRNISFQCHTNHSI